ncbi:MAG: deoxyguanosinetriphosphate triphosphohydrolase family protein [Candidatus Helarchaeota archaeon]
MDDKIILQELYAIEENTLSKFATLSRFGFRRRPEPTDVRPIFARDADRILHSLSFTRYIDKTQVFHLIKNDHITHRVIHVQMVSKIARQIARVLKLNEDLCEAIAIGHDIGHTAFGHDGEQILSELCKKNGIGEFHHSVQGIRFLDQLEKRDRIQKDAEGLNLTLQVLDGILTHDGEIDEQGLHPNHEKTWKIFDEEVAARQSGKNVNLIPMTLEGCLVRIVDTISYISRDFEDAIILGLIERDMLPENCRKILGQTHRKILNTLIRDIMTNSRNIDRISYSEPVYEALIEMKNFNRQHIYFNPKIKVNVPKIRQMFEKMFYVFRKDVKTRNMESLIFKDHVNLVGENYLQSNSAEEIVRDYLAGMTDNYFLKIVQKEFQLEDFFTEIEIH